MMGEHWDTMRIDYAIRAAPAVVRGRRPYGDGPRFHWDYYNSFVIQPMLLDVLRRIAPHRQGWQRLCAGHLKRGPSAMPRFRNA